LQEKRKKYDGSNNVEKNTHLQFLMICASEIIEVLNWKEGYVAYVVYGQWIDWEEYVLELWM